MKSKEEIREIEDAEFHARLSEEQAHPDVDHSETATRHLDIEGTWMEKYAEASEQQQMACKDLLKHINEQDKIRAIRQSMEASDRTKRIARRWKAERTQRRELEKKLVHALDTLSHTEYMFGKAVARLSRVGLLRRVWGLLFGKGIDTVQ